MTVGTVGNCPPIAEQPSSFSSLGAIDRIGNAFCQSAQDPQRINQLQNYRSFRMRCLTTTLAIVDACRVPHHATVSVRLKRLDSIRRKIGRPDTNFSLGRMDDVVGVRIVCQDLSTIKKLSGRIHSSPDFYRLKNYITAPARTGYRGINHIMKLQQPLTEAAKIDMRFEIQTRTYLQHCWAVWSESHGEAAKLGVGDEDEHDRLYALSQKIARWESDNPNTQQIELPVYTGGRSIAVCWRTRHGMVIPYYFQDEVQDAVDWLNYLETTYPAERENALLLVGVSPTSDVNRLLQLTHPLFTGVRVLDPSYWMPTLGC